MSTKQYFLKQAERCLRIARAIPTRDVAERLKALAQEYLDRADALDKAKPTVGQQQQQPQPKSPREEE